MSNFGLLVPRDVKEINEISLYGAEKIGNYAFSNCYNLTTITIPSSVTSIGNGAFYGCTSLIDCTILKNDSIITNAGSNFNSTNNKIYVPYSLLSSYKNATSWVGITDKIMGYQTFSNGEILPRYNTTHTFTWYPTKSDLIAGTNGIVANDTNITTKAGEWYCNRPRIQVAVVTDLINSSKSTSFIRPTSSSNAIQTQYINFDTSATTTQYPIVINCSVISYKDTSGTIDNYTNKTIDYRATIEFNNTKTGVSDKKLTVNFDTTGRLYIEMYGTYSPFSSEYWQQITINSIKQTTYEYQN